MKIGGNSDLPFNFFENKGVNPFAQTNETGKVDESKKTGGVDEVNKPEKKDGIPNDKNEIKDSKIDKTQFTNENDIQELDMNEFEDDFR